MKKLLVAAALAALTVPAAGCKLFKDDHESRFYPTSSPPAYLPASPASAGTGLAGDGR